MMPLWVALYFLLACALGAWFLLPDLRSFASRNVITWAARLGRRPRTAFFDPAAQAAAAPRGPGGRGPSPGAYRHAVVIVAALSLLTLPVVAVWLTHAGHVLSGFDEQAAPSQPVVVAALLQGEQLVAPAPLPPSLFMTPEVETMRPQLALADRRWEQFDPQFRQRLLWVYKVMKEEHGYDMVLLEGYRSPERQTLLSKLGPQVTNAGAWQSYHQYGLAADSAFLRQGKLVISERDPWAMQGYEAYGRVAVRAGLVWGGRWQNADLGHVELRLPLKERP